MKNVIAKITFEELIEVCEEICYDFLLNIPSYMLVEQDMFEATIVALAVIFETTPPKVLKSKTITPHDYSYVYGVLSNLYFVMRDDDSYQVKSPYLKERYASEPCSNPYR